MTRRLAALAIALGLAAISQGAAAQRGPDPAADVSVAAPAFAPQAGPRMAIDGGHHNFHTLDGRFAPFAALAARDGLRVTQITARLDAASLRDLDILVIANALDAQNEARWSLPTPSAFTPAEIAAVRAWVEGGGALLLIADHLPFAGAAQEMAGAFGYSFTNGFALRDPPQASDPFTLANGGLKDGVIVRGRNGEEAVTAVATFTGSAFKAPPQAVPVLALSEDFDLLTPQVAWEFSAATPRQSAAGYLQGAVMPVGKGRLAVFGEAAMFSAQLDTTASPGRIGFNAPEAQQNKQFILNLIHWLADVLPASIARP